MNEVETIAQLGEQLQDVSAALIRQEGGPKAALALLVERFDASGGTWLNSEETRALVVAADLGSTLDEDSLPPAFVERIYSTVFRYMRPVHVAQDADFDGSLIGAPIRSGERILGGIFLLREGELYPPFTEVECQALALIAGALGGISEGAEQVARTSARRAELEAVLASMVDGLLVIDRRGYISSFNDAFRRLSGVPAVELYEARWNQLIQARPNAPLAAKQALERFFDALIGGNPFIATGTPAQLVRPHGDPVPVAVGLATIQEGGRVTGAVLNVRDATVETHLERMKDDFIATVSHELKTPLTTISGFIELMRNHQLSRAEQIPLLDLILDEGHRLARMITDLLDLSKIQAGLLTLHVTRFGMRALIEECMRPFRLRHAGTHPIQVEVLPPRGSIVADRDRVTQVLVNLVGNAIKYSPNGGPVLVRATKLKDSWEIHVTDRGIGIPEPAMRKLFGRFYRVNEQQSAGSGLGLFITKAIVERHGGNISATSEVGEGSTFKVKLPACYEEEKQAALRA